MATSTVEDYLKHIFIKEEKQPGALVSNGALAGALGVTPGSATAMVKTLVEAGLVEYEVRAGVRLTRKGRKLAVHVLRRHRLIELFLVKVVGLDWSEVHEEAEVLEHALSDRLMERIDELLGRPEVDPHGHPIPTAGGRLVSPALKPLVDCGVGQQVRIARIDDEDAQFLRFAEDHGLTIGAKLRIVSVDALADSVTVSSARQGAMVMGSSAARRILVAG